MGGGAINPLSLNPSLISVRRPWVLTFDTLKNSVTLKIEKHVMLFIWCFEKLKTVRVIGSGILCGGLVATSSQCDWTLFEVPFRFFDRRDFTKIVFNQFLTQYNTLFCLDEKFLLNCKTKFKQIIRFLGFKFFIHQLANLKEIYFWITRAQSENRAS